ncbi:Uncharacterized protein OBRU01_10262 [Operophtera brumata]|uniref:G-protein coupled receptors family 1 profile domain-containing protein n=1 Tax=Operophtera brumata TaxID=104452 RepID=A0A0L7KZN8_OPEBR|nr:Uncharacterized protein OBRU01_10262 [Operophtera brumata]
MDFNSTATPLNYFNNASFFASNGSILNEVVNATSTVPISKGKFGVIIKVVYAIGIIGNAAAIIALRRGERRVRNRKHLLLLTSLAANDLLALRTGVYCAVRVVLRTFGVGSVCIAVTMALERYLALTRPFLYQKGGAAHVWRGQRVHRRHHGARAVLGAHLPIPLPEAILTCAPVLGVGLYYNEQKGECVRYRNATSGMDFAYAVFYRQRTLASGDQPVHHNAATAEEVAFSRLMATLSFLFMICWLPQMLTSVLYLTLGSAYRFWLSVMGNLSDLLMLLNYVLDPVLYGHRTSTESVSMKTSCCAPDTLVISDTSQGLEGRPLRALHTAPCN